MNKAHSEPAVVAEQTTIGNFSDMPDGEEFVTLNGWQEFKTSGDSYTGFLSHFVANAKYKEWSDNGKQGQSPVRGQFVCVSAEGYTRFNYTANLAPLVALPSGTKIRVTYKGEKTTNVNGSPVRIKEYDIQVAKSQAADVGRQAIAQNSLPRITGTVITDADTAPSEDADPFADDDERYAAAPSAEQTPDTMSN